ncbi:putative short-chain dehydrogenase [Xylariaceae sp. FL0804]|nr:putative short-chain dehydrogenase [Xylariaceae sp. FL0804]
MLFGLNPNPLRLLVAQYTPLPYPDTDCSGKVVLITGANTGLGLEAARHFVRLGAAKVILGCRSVERGEAARADLIASSTVGGDRGGDEEEKEQGVEEEKKKKKQKTTVIEVWPVDLASFASVRAFCRRADESLERLDVVVLNAFLAIRGYATYEGYERQLTVGVLSTFLMALMLLPVLRRWQRRRPPPPSKTTRQHDEEEEDGDGDGEEREEEEEPWRSLVIVGSGAHFYADFRQRDAPAVLEALRGDADMADRYNVVKLLDLLLARELAAEISNSQGKGQDEDPDQKRDQDRDRDRDSPVAPVVVVNTVNPGLCRSELFRYAIWPLSWLMPVSLLLFGRTAEMGSRTLVQAALAGPDTHGRYLSDGEVQAPSPFAQSEEGARVGRKVYRELLQLLEGVEPGISANI